MNELGSLEALEGVWASSEQKPVFLFKHSTRCPISAEAHSRVERFLKEAPADIPAFYLVNVVESRPVSNAIATTLNVKHESPQLILVKDRQALWHTTHLAITAEAITKAIEQLSPPPPRH